MEDQDRLAEIVAVYTHDPQTPPLFTEEEVAELERHMDGSFDPAPEHDVREFFDRHRG